MSFALTFPQFDPVLIELGPLVIRWYALAYLAGILIGWQMIARVIANPAHWGKPGAPLDKEALDDFLLWATLGIILGGRLGFILFYNFDYYAAHPGKIFTVWEGGMAFHGGLAGIMAATFLFARRRNVALWSMADLLALVAPIGLLFGRLANFINGELWGRASDAPWAVIFPDPRSGGIPRHPSQLYEAGLEGLVLMIVVLITAFRFNGFARPGLLTGIFFTGYGLSRIIVEQFREPDPQLGFLFGFATMGALLSLPMLVFGLWLINKARQS